TSETSIEETAPDVVARRQYKPATSDGKIRNTAGQVISTMIPMMLSGPKKATSRPPPTKNGHLTRVVTVSVRSSALVEAPRPATTGRTYSFATMELRVRTMEFAVDPVAAMIARIAINSSHCGSTCMIIAG